MNDFDGFNYGNGNCGGSYGVYTTQSQFQLDESMLLRLKFTQNEINTLKQVITCCGKVTTGKMVQMGMNQNLAKKIKYMYDIATGSVMIDSPDDLSKHLRKMFGAHQRIGIQHLAVSKIQRVPRKCLIGNVPAGTFEMFNSKHYGVNGMYDVKNVTSTNIEIVTQRKPVLKRGASKKLDGVLEITGINQEGYINVLVNKNYARLCNRFIIVASLRRPEYYHAMVEIICIEGTKIYVFAITMRDSETPNYKNGTQRVYDYGFFNQEIKRKLMNTATIIYKNLCGVYATTEEGNMEFSTLKKVVMDEDEGSEII